MTTVVSILNAIVTFLFGLAYTPLKYLGPFWSLAGISCLSGIFLVWIFGKISNQDAIQRTRNRLSGELLGLRLFKDDLGVFFGIQWQVLKWTFKYLRYSVLPMLILMIPTMIILIQLNLHYGARPLRVGEQALVKVKLREGSNTDVSLSAPQNLKIETQGVHAEELREISWRVRGASPGRFHITANDGKVSVTKAGAVGGRLEGVSTARTDWFTSVLYPGEAPIPGDSAIESIEVIYPAMDILFLGFHLNWLVLFLVLSLALGFAFKGVLGVQI
jgi:hypothetical protein